MNLDVVKHIDNMKEIQAKLLEFIENDVNNIDMIWNLIILLIGDNYVKNQFEFKMFLHILLQIANYHHHNSNFYEKIEKILLYLKQPIKQLFTNFDIFIFFKKNKRILLFLIDERIMILDNIIASYMLDTHHLNKYFYYFYPEIQEFTPNLFNKYSYLLPKNTQINIHKKLRKIGENESYISTLIRNDSVEEFIAYVNHERISLTNIQIKPSIYDTNCFLKNKTLTLIEYAVFFGAVQIVQYLKWNNIEFKPVLWIYAIHSNCPAIIHLLEEYEISFKYFLEKCLHEAIKCHHNDVALYINNLFDECHLHCNTCDKFSIYFYNYMFIQYHISYNNFFLYAKRDYFTIVKCMLNNYKIQNDSVNYKKYLGKTSNEVIQIFLTKLSWDENCLSFYYFKKLKQIVIPSTVKYINCDAFNGCISLEQISIPNTVKSIGKYAFFRCISLKQVIIPPLISKIKYFTFGGCLSFTKFVIPSSIIEIEDYAFSGCSYLNEIIIPFSVVKIGNFAFYGCSSLTQISIPSSVTSFGMHVFSECTSLKQITVPYYLPFLRYHEFYGCSSLRYISIPSSVTVIGNGAFYNCVSLTEIFIPSSVKSICEFSFRNCLSLEKVEFESNSGLETIEEFAFSKCTSLKEIIIPSSVTKIGIYAFNQCISLKNVFFEEKSLLSSIEECAFAECFALSHISIPSSVETIGKGSFRFCMNISHLFIPPTVKTVQKFAFFGCVSLTQISIPSFIDPSNLGLENNTIITKNEINQNSKLQNFLKTIQKFCINIVSMHDNNDD